MSTFSSEMKQMFKKWLYKPADSPERGGECACEGQAVSRARKVSYSPHISNSDCFFYRLQEHIPSMSYFELIEKQILLNDSVLLGALKYTCSWDQLYVQFLVDANTFIFSLNTCIS